MVRLRSMISFMVAMATQIPNIYLWLRYLVSLVAKSQDRLYRFSRHEWKSAWKISTGDLIYRISLSDNGLIENPLSDEPWTWKCWLTDLVKCPHSDDKWKDMKRNHEADDILWQSAEILRREFEIINPKSVIIVGQETANLFGK